MLKCTLDWLHDLKNQPNSETLPENEPPDFYFYWTGTAIDLLEIALSMRLRPESRTLFIDQMKSALELKMDMNDERERVRKKHN